MYKQTHKRGAAGFNTAMCRSLRGQSPHVVIDVHASMLATEEVGQLQQPVMQQPPVGPLPILLNKQQTLDPHQNR